MHPHLYPLRDGGLGMTKIFTIVLKVIAAILIIAMVWSMIEGRGGVNYGLMGVAIAVLAAWIDRREGRSR
jgi:hypothetical protein